VLNICSGVGFVVSGAVAMIDLLSFRI
jgi:hypothetical protein